MEHNSSQPNSENSDITKPKKPTEATNSALKTICPLFIGVAGGSASGKTTLCNQIIKNINMKNCVIISFDSFYKSLPPGTHVPDYNFDHPDALDYDLCLEVIEKLLTRQPAKIPEYSFITNERLDVWHTIPPVDLILLEGILAFHDPRIVNLMNLKIFVSCDDDVRLYRRVLRDVNERGRDVKGIIYQYNRFVKPAYDQFIKPTTKYANIIVPGDNDNRVAINFIVQNLQEQIAKLEELRFQMKKNIYHADILDTCWLNATEEGTPKDSKTLSLYMSQRILFLRDQSAKTEVIHLFNLLIEEEKFSKTLFLLVFSRFLSYSVKMLRRANPHTKLNEFLITHYNSDNSLVLEPTDPKVFCTIINFLSEAEVQGIKDTAENIWKKVGPMPVYVIAMFANIEAMTTLTRWDSRIHIINILCIVEMKLLIQTLKDRCKMKDFDFWADTDLVNIIRQSTEKLMRKL